ncbi:hypothetical protein [Rhizobium tropici]|uniref:XRE family transcriptional regulator n=1 Tax=Rhizobium tropici TaxID=398 RepID=A0A329YEQ5_RHITR|nr:hypothetical protein [Rhizobium tropici]RAX42421.1 hypothetical protein DQ393_06150 [Rhizobium tropici]
MRADGDRADFDRASFAAGIDGWLKREGLSYRAAMGRYEGLNTALLSRAIRQHDLSVANVLLLCRFAGLDPMNYLILPKRNQAVTAIATRETSGETGRHS